MARRFERRETCTPEAFRRAPDDYYTGINAAAKSVFLQTDEDLAKGASTRPNVQRLIGPDACPGDYWQTATVAECHLIRATSPRRRRSMRRPSRWRPTTRDHTTRRGSRRRS